LVSPAHPADGAPPVAVVTAAGGVMGTAICRKLAEREYHFVVNDRRDCLSPLVTALEGQGCPALPVVADVSSAEGAGAVIDAAVQRWGRVDVLVNVVGGMKGPVNNPLWLITEEQWHRTVAVNLTAPFFCMQRAAAVMMEQGSGKIVNIGSTSWSGSVLHAHYAAGKAGLVSLSRSAAEALGPHNINVNVVAPGGTLTYAADLPGFPTEEQWRTRNPLGRPNRPEDIAEAVSFLASEAARNISGQVLTVAGGWNPSL
jgi:NAD(P)-dependent dehydrogenase (short-subunit alcohol dehydrogenase family)